ncbi:MAG: amino acid adenylation domain-containing protein, partial [Ferruginibacter sp.]
LVFLWQEILKTGNIGINDNFFELGGHSLMVMRLLASIRKNLAIEIPVKELFANPTIAALAGYLGSSQLLTLMPPIQVAIPRPEHIPLSFSQERLWFIDRMQGSIQYHLPAVFRLKGNIDKKALAGSLQKIIERHESLRTVIKEVNGRAYQHIKSSSEWDLSLTENALFKGNKEALQTYIQGSINTSFDLSKDYMLRADLIAVANEEYLLVVTMHHIASDGWSMSILVDEVAALYRAFRDHTSFELTPLALQYADYAIWQRKYLQKEVLDKKINYWKQQLAGVTPLQLPTDYTRSLVLDSKGAAINFKIDKELSGLIQNLGHQTGTTLFMVLLGAFKVLLYRYTGQQDICVGTPVAGREQQELEKLIGFFINTLALRSEINGKDSFTQLLQKVKQTTLNAYEHQDIPFEKIVELLAKERDMSRSPVFQAMFVMQNTPAAPELDLGDIILSREEFEHTTTQFEISLYFTNTSDGLEGSVRYSTDLYKKPAIERLIAHFKELLQSIVKYPQQCLGQLPMLKIEERKHLLFDLNGAKISYPLDKSLVNLFKEQVAKTPGSTAVIFEGRRLSYKELNERSNQLAHYLYARGVKPETLVPLCLERSFEMIIGILGILKAGGAYVPIDPEYPLERIGYMLEDTAASIIVTSKESSLKLPSDGVAEIIELDGKDAAAINRESTADLQITMAPDHLAYVIYTSGSTGKPKGAMNEHRALVNRLCWAKDQYRVTPGDAILQKTTFSFDVSVWELLLPIISGARLVFAKPGGHKDNAYLKEMIEQERITIIHFVPSMLGVFLPDLEPGECTGLKKVLCSGEALKPSQVALFRDKLPGLELHNLYGPTEAAIDVTHWTMPQTAEPVSLVPIGKPVANTSIYILNEINELMPLGSAGEIHIGGIQVGRGYLNRPALTAEKFIADPFSTEAGAKMYKTGDLGRWITDGNIEYLGRIDDQVKIRGYRIELGEIETVLQQSGLVGQTVIVARTDKNGINQLIGYITAKNSFDKEAVIFYLNNKLPAYMVPVIWVQMESLPLTPNGKIDKNALPQPETSVLTINEYVPPGNQLEEDLAGIWKKILGIEQAGIHDNFFALGGHSLSAMQVISALRKKLELEVVIKDIFNYPTIASLANHLSAQGKQALLPSIEFVQQRPVNIPLSYSQERLWFIDQLEGSVQYHLPSILKLKGKVNKEALNYSLRSLVSRHEVLRTIIKEADGQPYQHIRNGDDWNLEVVDGSAYSEDNEALQYFLQQSIHAPFDLAKDYMLRAMLVMLSDEQSVLVITMHHIATDGWSIPVIISEVEEVYNSFEQGMKPSLAQMQIQYADYAIWQRTHLAGEVLDKKIAYWKSKLEGLSPLQLPLDHNRPMVQSTRGAIATFEIDKHLSGRLQELSQQQGATLFMTLLAAFNVLLHRYSMQEDICVGTPVANRTQQELEGLIGFFVNTLPLRNQVNGNATFIELLRQVKANTMEAYDHQEVPFEKVVEAVVKERDMSRSPLFLVMLVLQNVPGASLLELNNIQISTEAVEYNNAKFDITYNITNASDGLKVSVEYSTDLYKGETMARMAEHFKSLLGAIVKSPNQSIGTLQMLGSVEENQLLIDFNNTNAGYRHDQNIIEL